MFDIETWHARRINGGVGNAESHLEPAYSKDDLCGSLPQGVSGLLTFFKTSLDIQCLNISHTVSHSYILCQTFPP